MKPTINIPYVGCHVWSGAGHPSHGPEHGPKVTIPAATLGEIVSIQEQYAAPSLITVRWRDGTVSGHYFYELDCIGPFESPEDYVCSFKEARNAQLWLGPRGGFQQFTAEVPHDGEFYPVQYGKGNKGRFNTIEALLRDSGIQVHLHQASKR